MRVGVLIAGIVLLVLGALFLFAFFGVLLLLAGLVLTILGALLPASGPVPRAGDVAYVRAIIDRLWLVEVRQIQIEDHLRRIGERLGVPPPDRPPSRLPAPLFPGAPPLAMVPPPAPPAPAPGIPVPPPPAPSPPAAPARIAPARAPGGISRVEQQLGEKWFLWIGIVVLSIAFAFFLAIVLPRLTPQQIVASVFVSAIGLALLAEYLFARTGAREYAKALAAGAFGIAYIGVWGAGFFFPSLDFPWPIALGAVLALHAAAALRYRSPLLSVEVGLIYLAWLSWLRAVGAIGPGDFALLLASGGAAILGLVLAQRDARSALLLVFAFDAVTLAAFPVLAPYGPVAALSVAVVTAAVLALVRDGRLLSLPPPFPVGAWIAGTALAFVALATNGLPIRGRGGADDAVLLALFGGATAAFAVSELALKQVGRPLVLAGLLAPLTFPLPFLMARGDLAFVVYPALLAILAAATPAKGLAWFTHAPYVGAIAYIASGTLAPPDRLAPAWTLFFGLSALHAFLQIRSGHVGVRRHDPVDMPILGYAVVLLGFATPSGLTAVGVHAGALAAAILLNRSSFGGPPAAMAAVIVATGFAATAARLWALRSWAIDTAPEGGLLLAGYHVGVFLAFGAWILVRRAVESYRYRPEAPAVSVSWPALALLAGLLAQDGLEAVVLAVLPPAILAIGYLLDDPFTFNAAFLAMAGQTTVAVAAYLPDPARAAPLLLLFAAVLMASGFALEIAVPGRRTLARSAALTSALAWFPVPPLVFGEAATTTVSWTIAGATAVAWGLWRRFPSLRYAGFALFFIVLGKVFLYDIAGLELAVRVLALVIVAGALLGISYGYAQYRRRQVAAG